AASSRQADRIELRRAEFHEAVRHAYLRQAESEPDRFRVIAATARSVQEIHCEVVSVVLPVIAQRGVANGGS
ncbi:MAG: hypothetical protein NUW23_05680, partial [Firmicutes bacterium]|nr:hypothetical protein [Bacillota bacterium]